MGKMTDRAKENMAMGQKAMKAIDAYLTHIDKNKPRGRKIDKVALALKIDAEHNLARKAILIAQMHEAIRRETSDLEEETLENEFLKYVSWFSEQHGIQYAVWREMGVQVQVLAKAGITG